MRGAPTILHPAHGLAVGVAVLAMSALAGESTNEPAAQRHASIIADAPQTQNPKARAAVVRAMIILKIAPHLRLPDAKKKAPFRIGVVGKDLLANAILQKLPGKRVGRRGIVVEPVTADVAAATVKREYDLLYVATTVTAPKIDKILERHRRLATVLVCERPGFASKGGGIQLFVKDKKVRFEINQSALKKKKVRANPHLLKLSTRGPRK